MLCFYIFSIFGYSHLYVVNYVQCYISITIYPYYNSHMIIIVRINKVLQCCSDYLFPIFQDRSHCHDILSHFDLIFVQCFNAYQVFWLSRTPNCVAYFQINLDDLTIVSTSKSVSIPASFLWLGFLEGYSSSSSSYPRWLVVVYFTSLLERYFSPYLFFLASVRFWVI